MCLDSDEEFMMRDECDGIVIDDDNPKRITPPVLNKVKEVETNNQIYDDDDDDDDIESIDLNICSNEVEAVSEEHVKHKDILIPSLDSYEKIKWLFSDVQVRHGSLKKLHSYRF